MTTKRVIIALSAAFVALCAVFAVMYLSRDSKAPQIVFPATDIVYNGSEEDLLAGVTAVDDRDGDVTASLKVSGIVYAQDCTSVTATFAAKDSSGNVTGEKRTFQCTPELTAKLLDGVPTVVSEPSATPSPSPTPVPTPSPVPTPTPNPERPVLTLVDDEVTIGADENYYIIEFVESITDNKDDSDSLYYSISVNGDYDLTTPGTYEVEFVVTDSDGNRSIPAPMTIHVE